MSTRTKRIAKNTAFLYIRMLITMLVALYTSRVLLDTLGAKDFGLYHVVAGFILLAGFLQGALSGTTQRFIAFELGKGSTNDLRNVFSMSINIHVLFAITVVLVGGTLGTIYLPSLLTFDESRTVAVIVVFWLSLLSFMVNIAVVPFHAMIIAHEEMKIFAWVSLLDAFLKLGIVFLIQQLPYDPLIAYGALVFLVSLSIALLYYGYVVVKYKEQRYEARWDQPLFKKLISFSGWTVWGNAAAVFANQGTTILLNVFFGPVVNAAKSIGDQASGALNKFVTNLQLAINPQIIKSYSANDQNYTNKLLNYGSKYNFFLIFTLALPILLRTEDVLNIWLVEPPKNSALFLRLILFNIIIESISRPLITAAQATGKIKLYQFVVGGILLLNVPVSVIVLNAGHPAASVFIVAIALTVCAAFARVFMLKRIFEFSFRQFFKDSLLRIGLVSAIVIGLAWAVSSHFTSSFGIIGLLVFSAMCFVLTVIMVWFVGFENHERMRLLGMLGIREKVLRVFK